MAHVTVVYKLNGKLNIGILDKNANVDHFERLTVTNPKGFNENTFHVLMVGDGDHLDLVDIDRITCDIASADEDDMVALANKALSLFRGRTVFH